jgi:hypothetical protein
MNTNKNRNNEIESIYTKRGEKYYFVNVNFSNGTCGTHAKNLATGVWLDTNLTALELASAKKLALVEGKWTNYRKQIVIDTSKIESLEDDDVLGDIEAAKKFKPAFMSESEIFG